MLSYIQYLLLIAAAIFKIAVFFLVNVFVNLSQTSFTPVIKAEWSILLESASDSSARNRCNALRNWWQPTWHVQIISIGSNDNAIPSAISIIPRLILTVHRPYQEQLVNRKNQPSVNSVSSVPPYGLHKNLLSIA